MQMMQKRGVYMKAKNTIEISYNGDVVVTKGVKVIWDGQDIEITSNECSIPLCFHNKILDWSIIDPSGHSIAKGHGLTVYSDTELNSFIMANSGPIEVTTIEE